MGFFSAMIALFGLLDIIGAFLGLVFVIFILYWKLNCALYNQMLRLPVYVFKFIILPFCWLFLFIWELIRHPGPLWHFLKVLPLLPFAVVYGICKGLCEAIIKPFRRPRPSAPSRWPEPLSARPGLPDLKKP